MRIALTGANGQLGQTLVRSTLFEAHQLLPLTRATLDITDRAAVRSVLDSVAPDVVLNAAAYTAVDAAEQHPETAFAINEGGIRHVAEWASSAGVRVVYVSTDFVFDGRASRPYPIDAPPHPLGVYGKSKWAGETALQSLLPHQHSIVRTAWLYSAYQNNFVKTMLRLMRERDALRVVADQVGTPTSTAGLSACLLAVIERPDATGLFHWTDAGVASWYDFAVAIQEEALARSLLDHAIPIYPISTEQYPTPAQRPAYSVLDKSRALAQLQCPQVHWREALRDVIRQIAEQ